MTPRYAFFALVVCAGLAFDASAGETTMLTLNRDHAGDDCVWGPITIEQDQMALAMERPWMGKETTWGQLLPGTYPARATYRKETGIELAFDELPGQPASVLILGARTANGAGRVAIGDELVGNCRIISRKSYSAVARRLNRRLFGTVDPANAQSTNLRVRVVDR